MKIVVATDSFKNCLSSKEVAQAITEGIKKYNPDFIVDSFITCDGGEGSVESFIANKQGRLITIETVDAFRNPIKTCYGMINNDTAIIEIAKIIGLNKDYRKVMIASSFGVAKVMLDAKAQGATKIIMCLGGSATNDAGVGILEGLGARFYDRGYKLLTTSSGMLAKIAYTDFTNLETFDDIEIVMASDVQNYLLGEEGCTYCFGKQKGVIPSKMHIVDSCMKHYVDVIKKEYGVDLNAIKGGGAAGGIGSMIIGILNGTYYSGIELCIQNSNIEEAIKNCDLVITGEGQSDFQTKFGKLPVGILKIANKYHKPTICISGALGKDYAELYELGFVGIVSIADRAMNFQQALACAYEKLVQCTYTQIKMIDYFRKHK